METVENQKDTSMLKMLEQQISVKQINRSATADNHSN